VEEERESRVFPCLDPKKYNEVGRLPRSAKEWLEKMNELQAREPGPLHDLLERREWEKEWKAFSKEYMKFLKGD
jgi:hypothetical protein